MGNNDESFINNAVWESGSDLDEAKTSLSFEVQDPVFEALTVKVDDLVTFGPGAGTNAGGRGTPRYYGATMPYEARLHQSHGFWQRSSGNRNSKGSAMQVDWETPDSDGRQAIAIETAVAGRSLCFDEWGEFGWDWNCAKAVDF